MGWPYTHDELIKRCPYGRVGDRLWVRVERLQDISHDDIIAEGWDVKTSQPFTDGTAGEDTRMWFREIWDSIYAQRGYSWDQNPLVWPIEFKTVGTDGQ